MNLIRCFKCRTDHYLGNDDAPEDWKCSQCKSSKGIVLLPIFIPKHYHQKAKEIMRSYNFISDQDL